VRRIARFSQAFADCRGDLFKDFRIVLTGAAVVGEAVRELVDGPWHRRPNLTSARSHHLLREIFAEEIHHCDDPFQIIVRVDNEAFVAAHPHHALE